METSAGPWRLAAVAVAMAVLTACGGSAAPSQATGGAVDADGAEPEAAASEASSPLVGLWMQVHTCEQLLTALGEAGLAEIAPAVVGDFFPDQSPEELGAKEDLCSGARPQRHYHYFDASGAFGSLDQHRQQVDDGPYTVDGDTLRIGDETWGGAWTYTISGDQLSLTPMITDEQVEQALADPFGFSPAGWMVAVAYTGTTWKRVGCRGWC
jgi:hypothetical protein